MDDELKRARREAEEAPDDVTAGLRLAAIAERAGKFGDAWTAAVRLVGRTGEDATILAALEALAARNPAAMVGYLRQVDEERSRFSCATLARTKELVALVVLACEQGEDRRLVQARVALRNVVAAEFPRLYGVDPLSVYCGSEAQAPQSWPTLVQSFRRLYQGYPYAVVRGELLGDPPRPPATPVADVEVIEFQASTTNIPPASILHVNPMQWRPVAREVIARARSARRFELLPWLAALFGAHDREIAAEAVTSFQELTGRLAPPLDPEDLSRRWVR